MSSLNALFARRGGPLEVRSLEAKHVTHRGANVSCVHLKFSWAVELVAPKELGHGQSAWNAPRHIIISIHPHSCHIGLDFSATSYTLVRLQPAHFQHEFQHGDLGSPTGPTFDGKVVLRASDQPHVSAECG